MGAIIKQQLQGQDLINALLRNGGNDTNITAGASQLANHPAIQQMLMQQEQQRQAAAPKKKNILQSIGDSIIDPFKKTAGFIGLGGSILGNDHSGFDRIKSQFFGKDANLGLEGLKTIAGLGSFLVPGAGTLGGAVLGGGLSGALGGLSQANLSDGFDMNDFKDIAGGALAGGATGGVLHGVGGLFGKGANAALQEGENGLVGATEKGLTGKLADRVDRSILNITPQGTATGILDAEKLANNTIGILRREGENVGARGINNAYQKLATKFATGAEESINPLLVNNILEHTTQNLADNGIEYGAKGAVSTATEQLQNKLLRVADPITGEVPTQAGTLLKKEIDNTLEPVYRKIKMGAPLNPAEEVKLAFRKAIDQDIVRAAPELEPLYNDLTTLHRASPDATKAFNKGGAISSPLALGGVKVPTFGAVNTAKRGLSAALRAVDGAGVGSLPGVINNKVTRGLLSRAPAFAGGAVGDQNSNQQGISQYNQDNPQNALLQQLMPYMQQQSSQQSPEALPQDAQANNQAQRVQLLDQMINAGMKQSDAIARVNFMLPEMDASKGLSATQQQTQSKANLGLTGVQDLENLINGGADLRGAGLRGALPGFLKTKDDKKINLAKNQILEAVGRLQSGGAIGKEEREAFKEFVPDKFDDAETVALKLEKMKSFFKQAGGTGAF